ncbi:MAG: WYL domain-containing protein [Micrococcales bacterium]|nr:WYL domain-containing protein [Micrococcales bacterium]
MNAAKQTRASESFGRLSTVLNLLHAHPRGLSLAYLADEVGIPEVRLRQEILDFYTADTLGVRPDTIVFVSSDGQEEDPAQAEVVRVTCDQPSAELGVQLLSPQQWFEVYEKASRLAQMNPGDADLASAVEVIRGRILGELPARPESDTGRTLSEAITGHRWVALEYSRAWKPGLVEATVAPLRLVETTRGWELDAMRSDGELRTFIVDRIRSAATTGATFVTPVDIRARLAGQREVTTVDLVVPHGFRWAVDRYAEGTRS